MREAPSPSPDPSKDYTQKLTPFQDWLDGLNKELRAEDSQYYFRGYNTHARSADQPELDFPTRDYIVQIARFDPSKGIDTVIRSYGELRKKYYSSAPRNKTPQLCLAGHSSIDDPDASRIFDETMELIEKEYPEYANDISVMRLGPTDQELNVLMSNAKIALQLSTREGFEIKVSEALHKGIPVIATLAGGIPLQIQDQKSGILVEPGDYTKVASYLYKLLEDQEVYKRMSKFASENVSDEVGTVGNMLSWTFLADTLTRGERVRGEGAWVNDLAREGAGVPYQDGEPRLPRGYKT